MTSISKKVCLLGDFAVGKTSLVRRFIYNLFDDKYLSTIGVKVSRKTITVPRNNEIVDLTMMLWDLAGSEEFDQVRNSYLRGASGAILVCDLTRPETLDNLEKYANGFFKNRPGTQLILAANKSDLTEEQRINTKQLEATSEKLNAPYFFTSAKNGENVEDLFRQLGQSLIL